MSHETIVSHEGIRDASVRLGPVPYERHVLHALEGVQKAAKSRHPGAPRIVVRGRRRGLERLEKAEFRLFMKVPNPSPCMSQPVTLACFWRGARDLKEAGFPLKACGNDDPGLSCSIVTPGVMAVRSNDIRRSDAR